MDSSDLVVRLLGDGSSYQRMLMNATRALRSFTQTFSTSLSLAADTEKVQVVLSKLLGGVRFGQQMMNDLLIFAAETPLRLPEIQSATRTLLQYGFAGDQILPTLQMIGDVTGGDSEKFTRMALAFGRVASHGRLMGRDLNSMIINGFNPLYEISRTTGISMGRLTDMMRQGRIGMSMVENAFKTATGAGGAFHNMMAMQAKTVSGLWSTMVDYIQMIIRRVGLDIIELFKIKELLQLIIDGSREVLQWLERLDPAVKRMAYSVVLLAGGVLGLVVAWAYLRFLLSPIIGMLLRFAGGIGSLLRGFPLLTSIGMRLLLLVFNPMLYIVTALIGAFYILARAVEQVLRGMGAFGGRTANSGTQGAVTGALPATGTSHFDDLVSSIQSGWETIQYYGRNAWYTLIEYTQAAIDWMIPYVQIGIRWIVDSFNWLYWRVAYYWDALTNYVSENWQRWYDAALPFFSDLVSIGLAAWGALRAGLVFLWDVGVALWNAMTDESGRFWRQLWAGIRTISPLVGALVDTFWIWGSTWSEIRANLILGFIAIEFALMNLDLLVARFVARVRLDFETMTSIIVFAFTGAIPAAIEFMAQVFHMYLLNIARQGRVIAETLINIFRELFRAVHRAIFTGVFDTQGTFTRLTTIMNNGLLQLNRLPEMELPSIPTRNVTALETQLRAEWEQLDRAAREGWIEFRDRRQREIVMANNLTTIGHSAIGFLGRLGGDLARGPASLWQFDLQNQLNTAFGEGRTAYNTGNRLGQDYSRGLKDGLGKFDAVSFFSAEALSRLEGTWYNAGHGRGRGQGASSVAGRSVQDAVQVPLNFAPPRLPIVDVPGHSLYMIYDMPAIRIAMEIVPPNRRNIAQMRDVLSDLLGDPMEGVDPTNGTLSGSLVPTSGRMPEYANRPPTANNGQQPEMDPWQAGRQLADGAQLELITPVEPARQVTNEDILTAYQNQNTILNAILTRLLASQAGQPIITIDPAAFGNP